MRANKYIELINSSNSDDYIKKITNCGWTFEMNKDEVLTLEKKIREYHLADKNYTAFALTCLQFDKQNFLADYSSLKPTSGQAYSQILSLLKKVSNGNFFPSNILEKYDIKEKRIILCFFHSYKNFTVILDARQINDTNIFWAVNQALLASGSKKLFCKMEDIDSEDPEDFYSISFVSPEIYKKAVENDLIPHLSSADNFFSEQTKWSFVNYDLF